VRARARSPLGRAAVLPTRAQASYQHETAARAHAFAAYVREMDAATVELGTQLRRASSLQQQLRDKQARSRGRDAWKGRPWLPTITVARPRALGPMVFVQEVVPICFYLGLT
jgi:hypothetical protein